MQEQFKHIEITEEVYVEKFAELRETYWAVQTNVESQYDFYLIELNCVEFKKQVTKHVQRLIDYLKEHIVNEFLDKMHGLYSQF